MPRRVDGDKSSGPRLNPPRTCDLDMTCHARGSRPVLVLAGPMGTVGVDSSRSPALSVPSRQLIGRRSAPSRQIPDAPG